MKRIIQFALCGFIGNLPISLIGCANSNICKVYVTNNKNDGFTIQQKETTKNLPVVLNVISTYEMNNKSINNITINGQSFTDYEFNINVSDLRSATISLPADATIGDIYVTFNLPPIVPPNDFETDDWLTIIYFANSGIDTLVKVYNMRSPEDFIGLERKVVLNNQIHTVKVIGVNEDFVDAEHKVPVALTFQFDNLISNEDGKYLSVQWEKGDNLNNIDYWDSTLENALNGSNVVWENDSQNNLSVLQMINQSDKELAQGIKSVYRSVNSPNEKEKTFSPITQKTKLFCPTISNLFSQKGIQDTNDKYIPDNTIELYCNEGKQYRYYADIAKIGDEPIINQFEIWTNFDCLKFKDCISSGVEDESSYYSWSSSPNVIGNDIWRFYLDGSVFLGTYDYPNAIAPCFCI